MKKIGKIHNNDSHNIPGDAVLIIDSVYVYKIINLLHNLVHLTPGVIT